MFCSNCGKELPDTAVFCGGCGSKVKNDAPVEETPVLDEVVANEQPITNEETPLNDGSLTEEATVAEDVSAFDGDATVNNVQDFVISETPAFAEPSFDEPVKKKSKKKKVAILTSITAVVLAAAIVVAIFFEPIKGFFIKTFGSDEAYFKYVETKSLGAVFDDMLDYYDLLFGNNTLKDVAADSSIKLNINDNFISMFENALYSYMGTNMDLDWLKDVSVDLDVNVKDKVEQVLAKVNVGGKELIGADFIFDTVEQELLLGVPVLNEDYIKIDLASIYGVDQPVFADLFTSGELFSALPSKNEMNTLIDRYLDIIFDNFDNVDKSSETIEVNDVKQKVTVLEAKIDDDTITNICLDVLKTAKNDNTIKNIINDFTKIFVDQEMISKSDAEGIYDEFQELIEEGIEVIKEEDLDLGVDIKLVDYINSKHEIVGRKLKVGSQEIVYYATATDKNNVGFEFECGGIQIAGSGTNKNNTLNGEYTLSYNNTKICDLFISNFKTNSSNLNGNIKIAPSVSLLEEIGLDSSIVSALSIANPMLELNFENNDKTSKFDINIVSGSEQLFGITISSTETKPVAISKPDSVGAYDEDEIEEWASNIDLDELFNNLKDIGLPSDLIDALESVVEPSVAYDSYQSDYYDDSYIYDYSDYDYIY